MKKGIALLLVILSLIVAVPLIALAATYEGTITVGSDDVVNENFIRAGDTITINGTVNGDAILAGEDITINGTVAGDLIAATNRLTINGTVGGDLRAVAATIDLNGTVARNVTVAAATIRTAETASTGWSLMAAGADLRLEGEVFGQVTAAGSQVTIANHTHNDMTLYLGDEGRATIADEAIIGGTFTYTGTRNAIIESGATITGDTVHELVPQEVADAQEFFRRFWVFSSIMGILSLLLTAIVLFLLLRPVFERLAKPMRANGIVIVWGLLILILTPLVVIILLFTLVGIPLALILFAAYLVGLYIAPIFGGYVIGQYLATRFGWKIAPLWTLLLGTLLLALIATIPFVGWLVSIAAMAWFWGGVWETIRRRSA